MGTARKLNLNIIEDIWYEVDGFDPIMITITGKVWSKWFKRERKLSIGSHGYYVVSVKGAPVLFHRIFAKVFIPNPTKLPCINHKNGVKTDNSIDNLEWCSYSENSKHSYSELGRVNPKPMAGITGLKNKKSIAVLQKQNGILIKEWPSASEAKRELNINPSDIIQCCKKSRGRISAGGYQWEYKNKKI